ncbi:4-hydroxyphenylpyruvate dioxygenase [Kitasatospora sp. NPDC089509]|uniref:4-hydroxyphenylpyruvate dioxygenase n=1 Tax=Kitasatospora sp. NPDC089509 TaxID=3364079 RepID=UPI0037F5F6AC
MSSLPTAVFPADLGLDHVELHVADVDAAAADLCGRFGFTVVGTTGPAADGLRGLALAQGRISLALTAATADDHPATAYVLAHGDGVAGIALRTADAAAAFAEAVRRGGRPIAEPRVLDGEFRTVVATVGGFGDVVHTFVQRDPADPGTLPPGFVPAPSVGEPAAVGESADAPGLLELDHFAVCVPGGELDATIAYYRDVLGFEQTFEERIEVGTQAMNSQVVQSADRGVTFTVIEPDTTADPGQIDMFLKRHGGAGVQHLAFASADAVRSVRALAERGVHFLSTPGAYYDALADRVAPRTHTVAELRELSLLIDEDHGGQLFQIFTRSGHERRTLFFEVIERIGAETFGSSNIKALYEAVEVERLRQDGGQE